MKNLSILLVAAVALIFLACQKEADTITPTTDEMSSEEALKAYFSEDSTSSEIGSESGTGCQGKKPRPPRPEEVIDFLDADKDGKISLEEAKGPLAKDFDKADGDQDGFITLEELKGFLPPPPPKKKK